MVCIELGTARLRSDANNWIVEYKNVRKDGEAGWKRPRFFGSLDQALDKIVDDELKGADVTTAAALLKAFKNVRTRILTAASTLEASRAVTQDDE